VQRLDTREGIIARPSNTAGAGLIGSRKGPTAHQEEESAKRVERKKERGHQFLIMLIEKRLLRRLRLEGDRNVGLRLRQAGRLKRNRRRGGRPEYKFCIWRQHKKSSHKSRHDIKIAASLIIV